MATRVLFIGSSFTTGNNMTGVLREMAASAGRQIEVRLVTRGDSTLKHHWYNSEAVPAIDGGEWDFVVLQGHSLQALSRTDLLAEYAGRFARRIRDRGAKPVLFMSWPRQHLPEDGEVIISRYLEVAGSIESLVAPVGIAWRALQEADPDLVLYEDDRCHPNFAGSYLTACVLYATIFRKSPRGLTAELTHSPGVTLTVEADLAARLQEAAWKALEGLGGNQRAGRETQ
ncbi:MAG: hypothetical protein ACYTGB_07015 [Planctomycetota bacterium]|jgi:hypothetical protein